MAPTDLIQAIRKRPFEPFRLQISDGSTYEVRHPELLMVGLGCVIVGVPAAGQTQPVYERVETVSLGHIVKLLPLSPSMSGTSNGNPAGSGN